MHTHSLHVVPSFVSEMISMMIDVAAGSAHAATRNSAARASPLRRVSARSSVKNKMNANTLIAPSAIGIPPHTCVRKIDEYGLIIAAWQPDSPPPLWVPPGMNEQCSE